MRTLTFLAVGLIALQVSPGAAQIQERYTVEEVLPDCLALTGNGKHADTLGSMYREGICGGILSMMLFTGSELDPRIRFCAPADLKLEPFAQHVVRYIELAASKQTEVRKADFRTVALGFAKSAWPCK